MFLFDDQSIDFCIVGRAFRMSTCRVLSFSAVSCPRAELAVVAAPSTRYTCKALNSTGGFVALAIDQLILVFPFFFGVVMVIRVAIGWIRRCFRHEPLLLPLWHKSWSHQLV